MRFIQLMTARSVLFCRIIWQRYTCRPLRAEKDREDDAVLQIDDVVNDEVQEEEEEEMGEEEREGKQNE